MQCTTQSTGAGDSKDGLETDAKCTASCGSYSISTLCSGLCTAIDRNCAAGVRGEVTCNGSIVQQCPVCESQSCSASTPCPDGTLIQCTGSSVCEGGPDLCYVQCDFNWTWCPGFGSHNQDGCLE